MPLDHEERRWLRQARDSSLRTEVKVRNIQERLRDGDKRFDEHERRIDALERNELIGRRRQKWVVVIVSALSAAGTALVAIFGKRGP